MKVLVFDTETTGLPKDRFASFKDTHLWPHIIQLSCVLFDTESKHIVQMNKIIRIGEEVELTERSVEIHGITRERSRSEGISIADAMRQFKSLCNAADVVVAHNISFDKSMVMVESQRCGVRHELYRTKSYCCTMKSTQEFCNIIAKSPKDGEEYVKYPTLTELHEKLFGTRPANTHDAFVDVLICLRCYMQANHQEDICSTCPEFDVLFAVTRE
jgi:DNA polymerase III epsilon subunit-like protein